MMIKTLHELNVEELKTWFDKNLCLNAYSDLPIETLFLKYTANSLEMGSLPVRPKIFSKELRLHFLKEIEKTRVRLYYSNKPMVNGLDLKEKNG